MRRLVLQCVWGLPESENHEKNYLGDDDEIKYQELHDENGANNDDKENYIHNDDNESDNDNNDNENDN